MKIIVVDDDLIMLQVIKAKLLGEGHEVFSTNDAQDALDSLSEDSFDLIISDIMMPYISGIELLSGIRKIDSSLPIIIVSALKESEVELAAFELGPYDFIQKPIDLDDLSAKVNRFNPVPKKKMS